MIPTRSRCVVVATIGAAAIMMPALVGCAAWATYPPIPGAAHIGRGHHEPVPTLMATAVQNTHERHGDGDEVVFNLPPGTTQRAYEAVRARLGEHAREMRSTGEPAMHVIAVRVRTIDAEVDVIYPVGRSDAAHHRMETLKLRLRSPHGFEVTEIRRWGMRVQPPEPTWPDTE
jgi:hypothetical protein